MKGVFFQSKLVNYGERAWTWGRNLPVRERIEQRRQRRLRKRQLKSEVALLQTLSHLFQLVQFVKCWQFFLELNFKRLYWRCCLVFTFSTKREFQLESDVCRLPYTWVPPGDFCSWTSVVVLRIRSPTSAGRFNMKSRRPCWCSKQILKGSWTLLFLCQQICIP